MTPQYYQFSCFTRADRVQTIWKAKEAISRSGASVVNATLFSNAAAMLDIEVMGGDLSRMAEALRNVDLHFFEQTEAVLTTLVQLPAEQELRIALNITFIHNDPDLKIEVPAVPG